MEITQADIKADIEVFKARIATAERKLAALPIRTDLVYSEHRKVELKRQRLIDEIAHVTKLIAYAEAGLNDFN